MMTVTRRLASELPAPIESLAPYPTMIGADAGMPCDSKKEATIAARS
jgi:hypothetical protein